MPAYKAMLREVRGGSDQVRHARQGRGLELLLLWEQEFPVSGRVQQMQAAQERRPERQV